MMGAQRVAFDGTNPPTTADVEKQFRDQGHAPQTWSNGAGTGYERHAHSYHKRLYCTSGRITFHTDEGDFELHPGDRLDVDPGTSHGATVGPEGVTCVEAAL
ncbi:MAG TPA: cupin domain-containing protein [Pseudonocardiaceae bacterium]|jgi:quercetin dioxygenase-like cupin family protein|nr:cupin domain-containing protein [Pseudonocardiaceae bacterium]